MRIQRKLVFPVYYSRYNFEVLKYNQDKKSPRKLDDLLPYYQRISKKYLVT